jgi:hypothetical protein
MSPCIALCAKVTYLPNRAFARRRTVNFTLFIGIVDTQTAKPVVGWIIRWILKIRRRSNRNIGRNQSRSNRNGHPTRSRRENRWSKSRNQRIIHPLHELMTSPRGTIAWCVLITRLSPCKPLAFLRFARTAILPRGAVGIVPGVAAEEVVFGTEVPGYGVG